MHRKTLTVLIPLSTVFMDSNNIRNTDVVCIGMTRENWCDNFAHRLDLSSLGMSIIG